MVQVGTPDDILRNPANDYVRSFVRGVTVNEQDAVLTRAVNAGQMLMFDDVELPDSLAHTIARQLYA